MRNEETLKELYENFKTRAQNRKYEVRGGDTMARNLKYQFKYAIEQSFKPGADKHSMKSNRAEDGSRGSKTLSYADRKNLIDVSANFSNWMRDNHSEIKELKDINSNQ